LESVKGRTHVGDIKIAKNSKKHDVSEAGSVSVLR
jgi:hypothetical protein